MVSGLRVGLLVGAPVRRHRDLLSRLLRAEVDGDRLSETDLDNFFSILVVAGQRDHPDRDRPGVLAFGQAPEQWDRLRADPALLDSGTDEVIRWSCPAHFMRRAGALISPLRHPLASAKDLATLDRLSGGRLVVQPTVSWHRDEYAALGVPFKRRGQILDEQLEIWAKAWSGSRELPFDPRIEIRRQDGS